MRKAWSGNLGLSDLTDDGQRSAFNNATAELTELARSAHPGSRIEAGLVGLLPLGVRERIDMVEAKRFIMSLAQLAPTDPNAPEPDIDAIMREIAALQSAVVDLSLAIVRTVEYVGTETLPAVDGWSWFDALKQHCPRSSSSSCRSRSFIAAISCSRRPGR